MRQRMRESYYPPAAEAPIEGNLLPGKNFRDNVRVAAVDDLGGLPE